MLACIVIVLIYSNNLTIQGVDFGILEFVLLRERPLMTSDIRVGRGSKIAPKMGRYREGQGK